MRNFLPAIICMLLLFSFQAEGKKVKKIKIPTGKDKALEFVEIGTGKYLGTTEISNYHWQLFLSQSAVFLRPDSINKLRPDSSLWRSPGLYNEPYVHYYYNHKAYSDYPICAITQEQAKAFCNWLNRYYQTLPQFEGKKFTFRLPTRNEWRLGYIGKEDSNSFHFPWGYSLKRKPEKIAINYCEIAQEELRYPSLKNAHEYFDKRGMLKSTPFYDTTESNYNRAVVYTYSSACILSGTLYQTYVNKKEYTQTKTGLMHMAGNVSEWVQEPGRSIGGNFSSPGYFLRADAVDEFEERGLASPRIGFRVLLEISEN